MRRNPAGGNGPRDPRRRLSTRNHYGIDGVPIASTKYVSPNEIELTLGGQTELTGKHVSLSNPGGGTVEYFAALPSAPAPLPPS